MTCYNRCLTSLLQFNTIAATSQDLTSVNMLSCYYSSRLIYHVHIHHRNDNFFLLFSDLCILLGQIRIFLVIFNVILPYFSQTFFLYNITSILYIAESLIHLQFHCCVNCLHCWASVRVKPMQAIIIKKFYFSNIVHRTILFVNNSIAQNVYLTSNIQAVSTCQDSE